LRYALGGGEDAAKRSEVQKRETNKIRPREVAGESSRRRGRLKDYDAKKSPGKKNPSTSSKWRHGVIR